MKIIKASLYLCVILTQFFLLITPAMANNNSYTSNEEAINYFLIYDANGGDNVPAIQSNTTNIFYISNEIPTLANCTFIGWATTPNAVQAEYQPGDIISANDTLTILYAIWQSNQPQPVQTFTLIYDANGGEQPPAFQTNKTTETSCQFQLSFVEPVRAGYIFLGWSTSPDDLSAQFRPGDEFWTINELTIFYAIWQDNNPQPAENRYMLIYDPNGGSLEPKPQIEYDFDFFHVFTIAESKPVRPGWDFLGWNTDRNALTAQFQPNEVFLALKEENVLFAIWQQQERPPQPESFEYTLIYNTNGGFNTPAEQKNLTAETNCLFVISETLPIRNGYDFLGWALEANATKPICQPGSTLITTEKRTTLFAVWHKLPEEPSYSYLKELLGDNAVTLKCKNEAAGHLIFNYELKENTYSFHLNQTLSNNITTSLNIKPDAYLADYNADISGHQILTAKLPSQKITLLYDEENNDWITRPNDNIIFLINCQAPARPNYTELTKFLSTPVPVRLECINSAQKEHYPISLNPEQTGVQIGPSIPYSDNTYSCLLTFQAKPYIEKYSISYGPHKLLFESNYEQTMQLYYNKLTQTWQAENTQLPCFKLICTETPPQEPVYQYKLYFNANGGFNAPYTQMATYSNESYVFFIPQEQPTRNNYMFIGWAENADANQAAYQPEQPIILRKNNPEITLFAVWQPNGENKPETDVPKPPPAKPTETAYCLYYDSNGGLDTPAEQICYSTADKYIFEITAERPTRNGYTFLGWTLTPSNTKADYQAGNQLLLTQKQPVRTLYAVWQEGNPETFPNYNTGSKGWGGSYKEQTQPPPETQVQPAKTQEILHPAYIKGYTDGTIRPSAYLSRAEAAVMIYRLLNPDDKKNNESEEINWYANAVTYLKRANIIQGYQDGSIRANAFLTRAELATVAIRLHNSWSNDYSTLNNDLVSTTFPDVTEHWAAKSINQATALGWLHGYPDGYFRPNQQITRAEAVTLFNSLFGRATCAKDLSEQENLPDWPDNLPNSWYYSNMLEASNSHTYTINADTSVIKVR